MADDAYIHLRIANHLVNYGLPYFNLDSHVNASSSPVWTFFLSFLEVFPFNDVLKLSFLNALVLTLVSFLVFQLINSAVKGTLLLKCVLLIVSLAPFYACSFQQMEGNLACLFLFYGIKLDLEKKQGLLFYSILAALTRLEFFCAWPIFVCWKIYEKKGIKKELIISLFPLLIAASYEYVFFKSFVPHSIIAKSKVYSADTLAFFNELSQGISLDSYFKISNFALAALLLAVIYSFRYTFKGMNNNKLFSVALISVVIFIAYFMKKVLIFPWYLPLLFCPAFLGVSLISIHKKSYVVAVLLIFSSIPFIKGAALNIYAAFQGPQFYSDYFRSARTRQYLTVSSVIEKYCPNCSVLAPEVGGLGYGFKNNIQDAVGLASPLALDYHPLPYPEKRFSGSVGAIPADFVKSVNPDLVLSLEIFLKDFRTSDVCNNYEFISISPFIANDYEILKERPLWGSKSLYLFFNKSLPKETVEAIKREFTTPIDSIFKCRI
jgi:hypothetical protein